MGNGQKSQIVWLVSKLQRESDQYRYIRFTCFCMEIFILCERFQGEEFANRLRISLNMNANVYINKENKKNSGLGEALQKTLTDHTIIIDNFLQCNYFNFKVFVIFGFNVTPSDNYQVVTIFTSYT